MYGLSHTNKDPPSTNVFPINWKGRKIEAASGCSKQEELIAQLWQRVTDSTSLCTSWGGKKKKQTLWRPRARTRWDPSVRSLVLWHVCENRVHASAEALNMKAEWLSWVNREILSSQLPRPFHSPLSTSVYSLTLFTNSSSEIQAVAPSLYEMFVLIRPLEQHNKHLT